MQNLREKTLHVLEISVIMCPVSHAGIPNLHFGNFRKLSGDDVISAKRQAKGRYSAPRFAEYFRRSQME